MQARSLRVLLGLFVFSLPFHLEAQDSPEDIECMNWLCEASIAIAQAIDTLRYLAPEECRVPEVTILRTMHASPYPRRDGSMAPEVGSIDDLPLTVLLRANRSMSVVDSANLFKPGYANAPCAYGISPVDWLGDSEARLHLFRHFGKFGQGTEYFVWLHREETGRWRIVRVVTGRNRDVQWRQE